MSSSIKSPYVYSLSSTLGVRAGQARVRASGLPLLSLPLFQGPFLLDTGADLLLKPAHLLLQFTDEIHHTLRGRRAAEAEGTAAGRGRRTGRERRGHGVSREEEALVSANQVTASAFAGSATTTRPCWRLKPSATEA